LLKLNSVHCHDASPWVNAPIIRPSVAHHMSLYVKNYTQLRHVTNQVLIRENDVELTEGIKDGGN
ncbi:MAG: hypothetical protein Q8R84_02135, partial [Candidatus Nitrotoga sp.]|nr:hypothetical protein [Candidatus Nitrotoga sp.]